MADDNQTRRKDVANNVRLEIENLELKAEVKGKDNIIQLLREEVKEFRETRQTTPISKEPAFRDNEIQELSSALISKEIAVKQLSEDLTHAHQNIEQVHQQYAGARGTLEAKDATISRLRNENDKLQEILETTQNNRLQALDKLSTVQAELSAVSVDKNWLESQLKIQQQASRSALTESDIRETEQGRDGLLSTMESVAKDKQTLQELINTASHYEEIIHTLESGQRGDAITTQESNRFASASSARHGGSSPRADENYVIELGNKMSEVEERLKKAVVSQRYQLQAEREQLIQEFKNMQTQLLQHQKHHELQKNEISSKETLIQRLKAAKKMLETELDTLRNDLATSRAQNEKYTQEIRKFQHELTSCRSKVSKLETELENEKRRKGFQQQKMDEIEVHSHADKDELSKLKIQLREQSVINGNHTRALAAKDDLIKQVRERLEASEIELDRIKSQTSTIQVKQAESDQEKDNLREKIFAADRRFAELQADYDECRLKNDKLQNELLREYHQKQLTAEVAEEYKEKRCSDLENDLLVARNKLARLENAYETCQKEKLQFQQELVPANTKIAQLKNAYETSQQQKVQLQQDVLSSHKKLGEFEVKIERQKQEKTDLQRDMKVLESKCKKAEQQLQRKVDENQSLLEKLEEANRRVTDELDHEKRRDNTWNDQKKKYQELSLAVQKKNKTLRELTEEKKLLEVEIQHFKNDFQALNNELAGCQRDKDAVNSELKREREKTSEIEKDNGRLKQERDKLEVELTTMKDNNAQWKEMCEKIQSDKERLQQELLQAQMNISSFESSFERDRRSSQQEILLLRAKISGLDGEIQELRRNEKTMKIRNMELQNGKIESAKVERELQETAKKLEQEIKVNEMKENLVEQLKRDNSRLKKELQSAMKESDEFSSAYVPDTKTLELEFELVQNQLSEMASHIKDLEDERESLKQGNLQLQKENACLGAKNTEMESSYNTLHIREKKIYQELEISRNTIEELEKEVYTQKEINSRTENAFKNSETKREELSREIVDARKKLSELENLYQYSKNDDESREEIKRAQITKLENQVESLQLQKKQMQQLLGETRDAARKYQEELHTTQAQIQELQRDSEERHRDIHSKESQNKQIRFEKENLEKELESAQVQLVNTSSNVESFEMERYELKQEMGVAKEKALEWENAYKLLQQEHESLEKELRNAQKMVNEVESEFNKSHKEHQNEIRTNQLRVTKFESQVQVVLKQRDSLKHQLDEVREELKKTKKEYTHLQQEFIQHQQRCDSYRKELMTKTHLIEKLEEEKNALQKRMSQLRMELEQTDMAGQVVNKKQNLLEGTFFFLIFSNLLENQTVCLYLSAQKHSR